MRAFVEWLGSLPDRLKRPESLLMVMALLASVGAHMPPWMGLGALADMLAKEQADEEHAPPVEVSFEVAPTEESAKEPEPVDEPVAKAPKLKPKPERPPQPEKPKPKPEPKPIETKVSKVTVEPPPPPEPSPERKQSITQKSEDPNVEPPPDAKYLAEENRRVEEETLARVLSTTHDDPEPPNPSAPQSESEAERPGDDREQRGPVEGKQPPKQAVAERAATPPTKPSEPARESARAPARVPAAPAEPALAPGTVIKDPLGSFVLAEPKRHNAKDARRGSAGQPANLKVSWRGFEETFGEEQLRQDRVPPSRKRLGAGREKRWGEFRASIENYVVGVKPGNTTALNAAADPFAAYLAAFHRNLHMEFAHQFVGSLPLTGDLGDPTLVTKVEIVVNPDGSLDRVGIVKSSGQLMYDFGAFNAVQRGAPYPPPPDKIRSADGRTYLRWALHRNESQCGTWNAEPYIVKTPPRSPNDPKQDNVSPYRTPPGSEEHGLHAPEPSNRAPKHRATRPGETLGLSPQTRRSFRLAQR